MRYLGWTRFLRICRGDHDFEAFFAFASLLYWMLHRQPKHQLHVKRSPQRATYD